MIMAWVSAHHVSSVETFLKTDEFVTAAQKTFCTHFMLRWNDAVLDRKLILLGVKIFGTTD